MLLDQLLADRRSIRKYRPDPVPEEWVTSMVDSAIQSPSPSNTQPVRFLQIVSTQVRQTLEHQMKQGFERLVDQSKNCEKPKKLINVLNYYWRYSEFILTAPTLFAVGSLNKQISFSARLKNAGLMDENFRTFTDVDITTGFCLAAFTLKAQELGLGTCILTAPLTFIQNTDVFKLEDQIKIQCFVTAGFSDETPKPPVRLTLNEVYQQI